MERAIRIGRRELPFFGEAATPFPGRRPLTRRGLSSCTSTLARRPAANARSPLASGPNNSINIDKFTGFFEKLLNISGTFYQSIFNGLRISAARFPGDSGEKSIQELCKIQAGYFSTSRLAITRR